MTNRIVVAVLIAVLLAQLSACRVNRERQVVPPQTRSGLLAERIVGITTISGEEIRFDRFAPVEIEGTTSFTIRTTVDRSPYQIHISEVQRLWVLREETSTARTVGLVAAVAGAVALIAIAANGDDEPRSGSCPFVYSWSGGKYTFDAEPYGGATTKGLERDDYSELEHLVADNGVYRLLIRNELEESQFTDLVELQIVEHPEETRVVADESGQFYTVAKPVAPISAQDHLGNDLRRWLVQKDGLIWEPPAVSDSNGDVRHDIVMTFPKPPGANRAKLIANAGTGLWGSFMIGAMLELRGRDLDAWYQLVDTEPVAPHLVRQWNLREELFALKILVEEPSGWELRGILPGGGPYAVEDRIVLLDVSRVVGEQVRLRIRPPVGFWALNSFALDFNPDKHVSVKRVASETARDAAGLDVSGKLAKADGDYHEMPDVGDRLLLSFRVPSEDDGSRRTIFLHTRGYYRLHLQGQGEPNTTLLEEIERTKDAATRFAVRQYSKWQGKPVNSPLPLENMER